MPRFRQTTEILKLMNKKERIRNIGVIAHIDHGKTTMTDSLLVEAGLLPPQIAGSARALDYLQEEQKRGITMKTANISLLHEMAGESYVINLVDTPGHVDFTGKVARALRAIDGAVVVVDAVEEVMAQTETVTRQALEERVKPILFINKVDRLITELKLTVDEIQKKFTHITSDFNNLVEIYGEPEFKAKWKVDPTQESVAFGSALHRWGFTLKAAEKKGIKFSDILNAYENDRHDQLFKIIPLSKTILDMTVKNIPSPADAQKYRIPKIWKGNLDSDTGRAMLNCDDEGPTSICITNIQVDAKSGLVVTGRLFSGSVKERDRVYLVGAAKERTTKQVLMYMGVFREVVDQITAGNIGALTGLESVRAGETIIDSAHKDVAVPFEQVTYVSEPVMTLAVEPKNPSDLPRLVDAMERLSIEDPNLAVAADKKTGEYLLSGMGELHLETAIKSLKEYAGDIEIIVSKPSTEFRESIAGKGLKVMARSHNKQNSFWVQVEPLENAMLESLKIGKAENVWAWDEHGNVLMNPPKNIKIPEEVKEMIVSGFHWACMTGPLCEEPLKNVKVNFLNIKIADDTVLRESTQIARAVSRAILGSFLTAKPALLEPIYRIEVSVPTQWMGECSNILTRRRGKILVTERKGILTIIKGYIPVAETFELTAEMRSATSGRAFWQCLLDHWQKMPENLAAETIRRIRKKRGLPSEIPKPEKFTEGYPVSE